MGILTPTESRQDINMPVSGDAASAGSFASNVVQRLLNRIYMVERILDGYYNRAVTILGFFQVIGNVDLGVVSPSPTVITLRGNTTVKSFLRTEGRVGTSAKTIDDANVTSTLRSKFVFNGTLTANRTLVVDLEGGCAEGDEFTVWNNTNGTIYVDAINPTISQLGEVPTHTHQTFIANASGTMTRMLS